MMGRKRCAALLVLGLLSLRPADAGWLEEPMVDPDDMTLQDLAEFVGINGQDNMETWLLMTTHEIMDAHHEDWLSSPHLRPNRIEELFTCDVEAPAKSADIRERMARGDTIRGVNIGGWLVLEPWITPTLFMQFLSKDEESVDPTKIGMDPYSFCEALGPEEGNRQLRLHWDAWLKEEDIKDLAAAGITDLRVPVGDYMFKPWGPYVGCTEGALEQFDRLLELAVKYNMQVLIDVHTAPGGQNGFDNGGQAKETSWNNNYSFTHWETRAAHWLGDFSLEAKRYTSFDFGHFKHSLQVLKEIMIRYKNHPAILGVESLNEPWNDTPPHALSLFNWLAYSMMMRQHQPQWLYVFHDAFAALHPVFSSNFIGCQHVALDTHMYQAWWGPSEQESFIQGACNERFLLAYRNAKIPVIVGEWSLATDNCAMWLNGFQDSLPGYPLVKCQMKDCPPPYVEGIPGSTPDPSLGYQYPRGTGGDSGPVYGQCPTGKAWEEEDEFMSDLALAKMSVFDHVVLGQYFWNFKADEPRWSYLDAWRKGWFPDLEDLTVANYGYKFEELCGISINDLTPGGSEARQMSRPGAYPGGQQEEQRKKQQEQEGNEELEATGLDLSSSVTNSGWGTYFNFGAFAALVISMTALLYTIRSRGALDYQAV